MNARCRRASRVDVVSVSKWTHTALASHFRTGCCYFRGFPTGSALYHRQILMDFCNFSSQSAADTEERCVRDGEVGWRVLSAKTSFIFAHACCYQVPLEYKLNAKALRTS